MDHGDNVGHSNLSEAAVSNVQGCSTKLGIVITSLTSATTVRVMPDRLKSESVRFRLCPDADQ